MVEEASLGVSASLKQRCQSLLLVLGLLPHSNYIVVWVILLPLLLKKLNPQFSSLFSFNHESCQYAKLHRVHLSPRVNKQASAPFELVHSDVWGPCPVLSPTGFKYFVTFVDDFSCVTWLYLMKSCFELFSHFSAFFADIQTQFHVSMQTLRSDNAKKYLSEPFQSFMLQHGILHQTLCVDTPSHNEVPKRKNRRILEITRAFLLQMNVPKHFWVNTISIACFFINRMPSSVLNWATPYHQLFPNNPLFLVDPKVFGCTCFVRDVRLQVSKLDPKSLKCIFVGYSHVQKRYRCYCPTLRRYFVFIDIAFFETTPFSLLSTVTRQGEEEDLLVYILASPIVSPEHASVPAQVKPPISCRNQLQISYLLIHCKFAKRLWDLFLSIVGISWVFRHSVLHTLLAWQGAAVGKKRRKIWFAAPLCLFWNLWRARNLMVFENEAPSAQRIKVNFVSNLWTWANLFSGDYTHSVIDFFT